jgi:protein AroM
MFDGAPPCPIIEAGALDGLSDTAITELEPRDGEIPLVTKVRDGSEVLVAEQRLVPLMQEAVNRAVRGGATLIVILCGGEFPEITATVPVIFPDRLLPKTIDAVLPKGRIGVIIPHAGQAAMMRAKWSTPERDYVDVAVSPYRPRAEIEASARELTEQGADLVVIDCMGFDGELKRAIAKAADRPTVLANRLVGRVVEELVTS